MSRKDIMTLVFIVVIPVVFIAVFIAYGRYAGNTSGKNIEAETKGTTAAWETYTPVGEYGETDFDTYRSIRYITKQFVKDYLYDQKNYDKYNNQALAEINKAFDENKETLNQKKNIIFKSLTKSRMLYDIGSINYNSVSINFITESVVGERIVEEEFADFVIALFGQDKIEEVLLRYLREENYLVVSVPDKFEKTREHRELMELEVFMKHYNIWDKETGTLTTFADEYKICYERIEEQYLYNYEISCTSAAINNGYVSGGNSYYNDDFYDVDDYDFADDFADDYEDEFDSWDDAFDYWEEHH